ncbi:MAG: hypothetical protein JRJ12_01290 [Deltaproteobacteria bacterium]|nr:hypothetical protein [Deltaproteobacteria bacterium]MBW2072583.1 hypothetical protein [Deltaproteobacteria bacterium]
MARIIPFDRGHQADDNLISQAPLEFRRGDWLRGEIIQCLRSEASKYQAHRREALRKGHRHLRFVPEHFSLVGGCNYTARALFRWRQEEDKARDLYRLAGLMECVVNGTCPVLRTDLLHSIYKTISELRQQLRVSWLGGSRQFLLPLHAKYYERTAFFAKICEARTLKGLYDIVELEASVQFDLLATEYVFYLPESLVEAEL